MFSESDLDAAVRGGALTADAAASFRVFMARSRAAPGADEESFRLLTGFNDIFVTIAIALVLVAVLRLLGPMNIAFAAAATAATSWGLAEYFTRRRRMALPSIVLLIAFVGGVAGAVAAMARWSGTFGDPQVSVAPVAAVSLLVAAVAAYAHWRRFKVPITVAAGTLAVVGAVIAVVSLAFPAVATNRDPLFLFAGLCVFAYAMRWDASDPERVTRRSDTAFWLHLAAAPLIVHPVFGMLGLLSQPVAVINALIAVLFYLILAVIALVVDRRAILASALAYVLWAMTSLLAGAGNAGAAFALAALGIGSGLLLLSALWQTARRVLLGRLSPRIRGYVPAA